MKEYERISIGKEEEKAERLAFLRSIESAIINFGGMGTKSYLKETQIRPIPLIDNVGIIMPIRDDEQAYRLLNKFVWQD